MLINIRGSLGYTVKQQRNIEMVNIPFLTAGKDRKMNHIGSIQGLNCPTVNNSTCLPFFQDLQLTVTCVTESHTSPYDFMFVEAQMTDILCGSCCILIIISSKSASKYDRETLYQVYFAVPDWTTFDIDLREGKKLDFFLIVLNNLHQNKLLCHY